MADPVTIAQQGGERLTVELGGAYLPTAGINVGGEYRQVTHYPPGAKEPIRQKLGHRARSFVIEGVLDDYDADAEDGGAADRVRKLEIMHQQGHDVRVTWGKLIDRVGVITELDIRWELGSDGPIPYVITIEPHKVERRRFQAPRTRTSTAQADALAAARAAQTEAVALQIAASAASAATFAAFVAVVSA